MTSLGLVACAPLEQAPLVYSSKNQIGVGVSAGTPDSPGLDIAIGYKGLDAAYVPVAVSKPCPKSSGCTDRQSMVEIVKGGNTILQSEKVDRSLINDFKKDVANIDVEIENNQKDILEYQNILNNIKDLAEKKTKLGQLQSTPMQNSLAQPGAPPLESPKPGDSSVSPEIDQLRLAILNLEKSLGSNKDKTDSMLIESKKILEKENTENTAKKVKINEKIREIESRLDKSSNGDKSDAFSVFGSFKGAAKGDGKSADINLGKVFSTGVAAQILTEGIGRGAELGQRAICVEKFIASAQQLKDEKVFFSISESLSLMADATKLCSSAVYTAQPEPRSPNN
jgi:hypothetical protein